MYNDMVLGMGGWRAEDEKEVAQSYKLLSS